MHGFILLEFEKFVIKEHGFATWNTISKKANAESLSIDATQIYPDSIVFTLVGEAIKELDVEPGAFLERFGYALVPNLLKVYKAYIDPTWKTIDLLEHTENTMHHAVRTNNPDVTPPILEIKRKGPRSIHIHYRSKRNIPQLGVGVIKGIADHYGELHKLHVHLTNTEEEGVYLIDVALVS
ncbi:heme NO-binding domain-containing protein [Rufibacter psychrotolerans]|uniref:heme NO-binding domain-containing protein n=1 Tax=Rufibacter psychrotolerans TaxID=2812556 RepID=UPI001967FA8F|nr:heme NO-binding domain-containing protein [Rufibacter sp. SYSU D00308]